MKSLIKKNWVWVIDPKSLISSSTFCCSSSSPAASRSLLQLDTPGSLLSRTASASMSSVQSLRSLAASLSSFFPLASSSFLWAAARSESEEEGSLPLRAHSRFKTTFSHSSLLPKTTPDTRKDHVPSSIELDEWKERKEAVQAAHKWLEAVQEPLSLLERHSSPHCSPLNLLYFFLTRKACEELHQLTFLFGVKEIYHLFGSFSSWKSSHLRHKLWQQMELDRLTFQFLRSQKITQVLEQIVAVF